MGEEQKKSVTVLVGSIDPHNKARLLAAISAIEDVKVSTENQPKLIIGKSDPIIDLAAVKAADGLFKPGLPGLGFGLLTDVAGIPLDLRAKGRFLPQNTRRRHRKQRRK